MSGHYMTVEWDGYDGATYTFNCEEPAEALCRAIWDCDCEYLYEQGVDARGPWHQIHRDRPDLRHYGTPGGPCSQLMSIESDPGEAQYMGSGKVRIPIDLTYSPDDEAYLWEAS